MDEHNEVLQTMKLMTVRTLKINELNDVHWSNEDTHKPLYVMWNIVANEKNYLMLGSFLC